MLGSYGAVVFGNRVAGSCDDDLVARVVGSRVRKGVPGRESLGASGTTSLDCVDCLNRLECLDRQF